MEIIFIACIGLVIGSFLNVCIYRIPAEQSISFPPSHCSTCNHQLAAKDLVPVFSYLFLRGKCRYCGSKISIRYPLIEILNGLLYVLVYFKYGFSTDTIKYCLMASVLIVIAMIDFDTQDVYTSTTLTGAAIAVIFLIIQYFTDNQSSKRFLIGGIVCAGIIAAIVFLTHGMGEGDIEIAGVSGLFLGWKLGLMSLFIAIIIGGIFGIVLLALKKKSKKEMFAFGPCIAIGTMISALAGEYLLNFYLALY